MKLIPLLIILGSVLLTSGAQLALKIASGRFEGAAQSQGLFGSIVSQLLDPLTMLAICLYVGSMVLWLLALRHVPLSLAFPFSGLTIAVVALLSSMFLGETINGQHAAGMLLIMLGVGLLARSAS